jgi:hypothetical protein
VSISRKRRAVRFPLRTGSSADRRKSIPCLPPNMLPHRSAIGFCLDAMSWSIGCRSVRGRARSVAIHPVHDQVPLARVHIQWQIRRFPRNQKTPSL